jgi:glycosyltransferase involved in cell wall biosynthesis
MQFYAAADAYVGPSLEDAYGLPILEAMACGLPVIASSRAGVSEIITHRKNGMILRNPQDSGELAELLRELCSNPRSCEQIGREAVLTAGQQTWERNAAEIWELLKYAAEKKIAATNFVR